jgi:nitrite reductase/ring-hydroxylating ferredoxin subunit
MSIGFVRVAGRGEIRAGEMMAVEVEGDPVLLCNVDGEYYAVHDECTHECFPLSEGTLKGHCVTCLLHGARFDVRNGEVLALPAYGPVKTYAVRVEGDDILIAAE